MLTTETSGCAGSTRTVATIESFQFLRPPDSNSMSASPRSIAVLISVSSGECFPSSDSRSSPGVGRRPTAKIEYFALWDAPIMPEKCAPEGYSKGCVAFVQVLLMITVYSVGAVGIAGGADAAAPGGAALFDPFPQPMTSRGAIRYSERRARMTVSITRKGFPSERVQYRTRSTIFPALSILRRGAG